MVRSTVEKILNDMWNVEADRPRNARKYERIQAGTDGRAGHYKRKLRARAGEVELNIPKLCLDWKLYTKIEVKLCC